MVYGFSLAWTAPGVTRLFYAANGSIAMGKSLYLAVTGLQKALTIKFIGFWADGQKSGRSR